MPCGATKWNWITELVVSAGRPTGPDALGVAADLGESMVTSVCASSEGARAAVPLDEEGQLRVGLQAPDAELAPLELA